MTGETESPAGQGGAKRALAKMAGRATWRDALDTLFGPLTSKSQTPSDGKTGPETPATTGRTPGNAATPQHLDRKKTSTRKTGTEETWAKCRELAEDPKILDRLAEDLERCGVVGEKRVAKLIFLSVSSRLLQRPVSAVIKGPASAGKSYLLGNVLRFFPETAFYAVTAMSEKALVYLKTPIKHRMLVVMELAGLAHGVGAYLMRTLLSEGRLHYETLMQRNSGSQWENAAREIEGPTGLLVTTTRPSVDAELETRIFSIPVDDSPEQTKAILLATASGGNEKPINYEPWHALQTWIEQGEHRVTIPFARKLADAIPPVAVRLRRDISAVLNLIKTHAILHQATRERDKDGRIIATLDDYAAVYDLTADLVGEGVGTTIKPSVRETVEAVVKLLASYPSGVPLPPLAEALGIDKSSASRRAASAVKARYLRNLEDKAGKPAQYVPDRPLPDDVEVLPRPETIGPG